MLIERRMEGYMRLYKCRYPEVEYDWTKKLNQAKKDVWHTKQEILSYVFQDDMIDIFDGLIELICVDIPDDSISNIELKMIESGQIDLNDLRIQANIKILKSWELQELRFGKYRWIAESKSD